MTGEVDRVREVYEAYARDPASARRWDPSRPGNRAMSDERARAVDAILRRNDALPVRGWILDVGCGNGSVLATFAGNPDVRLAGIDLSPARVRAARPNVVGGAVLVADGASIPFDDASIDLCLAFTVFSSILDDELARDIATEMWRVTKSGGSILIYDLRYRSRNRNTRPVSSSSVRQLFGATPTDVVSLTLVPPLSRALGSLARWAYAPLAAVPALRTHQLVLLTKT